MDFVGPLITIKVPIRILKTLSLNSWKIIIDVDVINYASRLKLKCSL